MCDMMTLLSIFQETTNLGKYIGVPLLGRAPKPANFQYIIDQVKLVAWKAKVVCRKSSFSKKCHGSHSDLSYDDNKDSKNLLG
jgi:hypothetical protein